MRDGWREVRLGDVVEQVQRPVAVAELAEVPYAGVRWYAEGVYARPVEDAKDVKAKTLNVMKPGDITYNRMWATKAAFGVADESLDGCMVTNDFPLFVAGDRLVPGYLSLVFTTPHFQALAAGLATGTTERRRLKEKDFLSIPVDLPPLVVQRRVVDLVDAVDTARAEAQRLAERSVAAENAIRSTVMDELLATQSTRLAEVVQVTNGRQRSPKHAQGDDMHRYVRAANVKDGALVLDEPMFMNFTPQEQVRYRLVPGDVLVTEGCGSRSQIGASCQWAGEIEGVVCFQNHLLRLRTKDEAVLPQRFVYQWALWAFRTGVFAEIATGTNIFSLGTGRVSELSFPRAGLAAFHQALGILEEAEHHSKAAVAEAVALSRLRSALLGELLSGDREIPDTYDDLVGLVA